MTIEHVFGFVLLGLGLGILYKIGVRLRPKPARVPQWLPDPVAAPKRTLHPEQAWSDTPAGDSVTTRIESPFRRLR